MSFIDLICMESVSLIKGSKCFGYNKDRLHLGCSFQTYLYFELPPTIIFSRVKEAKLILFKIPINVFKTSSTQQSDRYRVCPLLDYFSTYSNWYQPPRTDDSLTVNYEDQARMSYTEIDITTIAEAWTEENPENKGLLLTGAPDARYLVYASDQYETIGMRPRLRLAYEGVSWPLSSAPCTVVIQEK